jgi:hypothetical protein
MDVMSRDKHLTLELTRAGSICGSGKFTMKDLLIRRRVE